MYIQTFSRAPASTNFSVTVHFTWSHVHPSFFNREIESAKGLQACITAEVTALARDKVLMRVEKALNFWVEGTNRKRIHSDGKVLR